MKWILLFLVGGYAALCALVYFTQRSLMYFPDRVRTEPADAGLPEAKEEKLITADGETIIVWHIPPRDGTKPVIVYFHGNGGALNLRVQRFARLAAEGFGIVGVSYRGYGGSTGTPTELGLIADGIADEATLAGIEAEHEAAIDAAIEFALAAKFPDVSELRRDVYADDSLVPEESYA